MSKMLVNSCKIQRRVNVAEKREIKKKRQLLLIFGTNPNLDATSFISWIEQVLPAKKIQSYVCCFRKVVLVSVYFFVFVTPPPPIPDNKTSHWQGLHINGPCLILIIFPSLAKHSHSRGLWTLATVKTTFMASQSIKHMTQAGKHSQLK